LLLATPAGEQKFGTQAEDVLFAYQKDILFGGDGSDILGTLTDKGQNRLYGGVKISICWRQRQAIWGKGDDILFNGGSTLTGGDGRDLFDCGC